jgi:hypothetical protein
MNKPAMLAPPAPQKFKTPAQIRDRISWLNAQNFAKGERGIGSRDRERKILQRRLQELMNPQFGEINQPPLI